jgi:WhiB family redox-sensing transcriptional regulator
MPSYSARSTISLYRSYNTSILLAADHRKADRVQHVVCTRDPDRWTTVADEGAKELCRACPRRWRCAQEACETPGAEGLWAGILIPQTGRGRRFALKQLRSLAELNGFPIREA